MSAGEAPGPVHLGYADEADEGLEGLAAERTEMAWSRSGLAMMACGAVIAKGLPTLSWSTTKRTIALPEAASHPVLGGSVLAIGMAVWLIGLYGARRRRLASERAVVSFMDLAPTAFGTAAVGVAALVLAFFLHD